MGDPAFPALDKTTKILRCSTEHIIPNNQTLIFSTCSIQKWYISVSNACCKKFVCMNSQLGYALVLDGNTVLGMSTWTTGCWRYIPDCTDGMSLALWLKVTTTPGEDNTDHGIMSTLNSNMGNGFFLTIFTYTGTLYLAYGIHDPMDGDYEIAYYEPADIGSWNHYVFDISYNSGNPICNIYKDGNSTPFGTYSSNSGFSPSSTPRGELVFGNMYADNPDSYMPSAIIDEVLLFNYTLSHSDVTILFGTY